MDISLNYSESGTGRPLILLHGNGENNRYFRHQIPYFSKMYRVISIDTRGHGLSPRGTMPFTIGQFAEDLLFFMNEHSIKKASILGFSDGGSIALKFALKYPKRVDRLILNGANLNPRGVKPSVQIPIIIGYQTALLFGKISKNAKRNAELLGLMVREPNINPEKLKRLQVKTLVIAGERDMIKEQHTKKIYSSLPNAQLAIIPGNHFIADKNPGLFNKTVLNFLQT